MSKLANKLPRPNEVVTAKARKGPLGACDVYGPGDLEDWAAVTRLRRAPNTWADAQVAVDTAAGIATPINDDRFRYHWSKKCDHWTVEQKRAKLEDIA